MIDFFTISYSLQTYHFIVPGDSGGKANILVSYSVGDSDRNQTCHFIVPGDSGGKTNSLVSYSVGDSDRN